MGQGANLEEKDKDGNTALLLAARFRSTQAVAALVVRPDYIVICGCKCAVCIYLYNLYIFISVRIFDICY